MLYNTAIFCLGFQSYCAYCGKKAINDYEISERDRIDYFYCLCDSAKAEYELNQIENEYKKRMKINYEVIDKMKIDYKVEEYRTKLIQEYKRR